MDKKKMKEAIDRKISDKPLFTEADRRRFQENKQKVKSPIGWIPAFPKVVTAFLALLVIGGSIYVMKGDHPFQKPGSPLKDTAEVGSPPSNDQKDAENASPVDYSKVKARVKGIKEQFNYEITLQKAQAYYGKYSEGLTYEKTDPSTGETYLTSEFLYFKEKDFKHSENMSFSKKDFQKGNLGLLFEITWENEKEIRSAMLTYLGEDGKEIVTETYNSDGYFEGGEGEKEQVKNPLDLQGLVLESIGESLNKNPASLTKSDLGKIKKLSIDASHLNGIYDVKGDPDYFTNMTSLTELTLQQAKIPAELLKHIPNLKKVTFKGPTLNDLSSVAGGLNGITYLDIEDSSFRGNANDILQLEQLETVVLDESIVTDWERLEENGIKVK